MKLPVCWTKIEFNTNKTRVYVVKEKVQSLVLDGIKRWLGETGHDVGVSWVPKWDDTDKESGRKGQLVKTTTV